ARLHHYRALPCLILYTLSLHDALPISNPQYTTKRKREERLALMKEDIIENENVVISGSLVDWGDELIPMFTLVVRLVTDTETKCILSCGNGCSMGNEQALLHSGNSAI